MDSPQPVDQKEDANPDAESNAISNAAKEIAKETDDALRLPAVLNPETTLGSNPLILISPFFLWGTAMVAMKGVLAETCIYG